MRLCRPLALLGLVVACCLAAPIAEAQVSCTGVPTWNATTVYQVGNEVQHQGRRYRALVQGANIPPNHCPSCGWWQDLGACGGGGGDTTPPTVALSSPAAGATVSGTVTVSATASDAGGVASVTLLVDGAAVGAPDTAAPYSFSWNTTGVANGGHTLAARAVDAAGNSATSASRSVTVSNGGGGTCTTVPPAPGGLNSPSRTATSVSLAWNAVSPGPNCTIQYRVFRGDPPAQVAQVGTTSHTVSGLAASTTYVFRVAAVSQAGSSPNSGPLSVTTNAAPPPPPPPPGGPKILGYFVQWGVYARNYHVKNIQTSGSASKLTHINYAFGNVVNGQCVLGDTYADFDRFYDAATSVDGVADTWDTGALRGNFGQLRRLKRLNPNLRVLFSFGGWTWSGGFGQAAQNPTAFANSCFNLVEDPRWADVFDGIDIDWEYPNSCGLSCDSSGPDGFVRVMQALRQRFGSSYLVTAAVPAGFSHINAANYGGAAQYVDWYNVMTYDFFGAWAASGPTAPHSPLTSYAGIPQANFYSDYAIQLYKSKGVPASKLLLGIGFYGRGWSGVGSGSGGLGQSASGPAPGTYEQGNEDYKVLVTRCPATGTVAGTSMALCGNQWWSYDTPASIATKMTYKRQQGLGGTFFWELSGDTSGGALITALYNNR
jgi:chitinase